VKLAGTIADSAGREEIYLTHLEDALHLLKQHQLSINEFALEKNVARWHEHQHGRGHHGHCPIEHKGG